MTVRVNRVEFENRDTALKIFKAQGRSRADVLSLFSSEDNRRHVLAVYDTLEPMSVREALSLGNAEQRMAALASFDSESILDALEAERIDRQVVVKTQPRWSGSGEPEMVEFRDEYELSSFRIAGRSEWDTVEVFMVRCTCPSTDKVFHLYVPEAIARRRDAIAAVAWTMQIDGQPISKQQYLDLMYAES